MVCEKCKNDHNGSYGSGRFCSSKCARSFSTSEKRKEINKKVSNTLKGYKTVSGGKIKICDYGCGQEASYQLKNGKWCCQDSYNKCPSLKSKNSRGLKTAHKRNNHPGFPKDAYLKAHESYRKNLQEKYKLLSFEEKPTAERRRIVLNEQEGKCLICKIDKWCDKPITLHFDHIDGDRHNNKRENVRFICPNCHSQTKTYCKGNNKNLPDEKLKNLLIETNFNFSKTLDLAGLCTGGYNWNRLKKISNKCLSDGTGRHV